jgi:hypothetical protein
VQRLSGNAIDKADKQYINYLWSRLLPELVQKYQMHLPLSRSRILVISRTLKRHWVQEEHRNFAHAQGRPASFAQRLLLCINSRSIPFEQFDLVQDQPVELGY